MNKRYCDKPGCHSEAVSDDTKGTKVCRWEVFAPSSMWVPVDICQAHLDEFNALWAGSLMTTPTPNLNV